MEDMYEDGEVLGLDIRGCVIQWDKSARQAYVSGESLSEFGVSNLLANERTACGLPCDEPAN